MSTLTHDLRHQLKRLREPNLPDYKRGMILKNIEYLQREIASGGTLAQIGASNGYEVTPIGGERYLVADLRGKIIARSVTAKEARAIVSQRGA